MKARNITLLCSIILVVLLGVESNIATAKITEIETHCGLFDCYTLLEIDHDIDSEYVARKYDVDVQSKSITGDQIDAVFNIPKTTKGLKDMKIIIEEKDLIRVVGTIVPGSKNYWGMEIFGDDSFWNSVWWNSSFDSCVNVTLENWVDSDLLLFPYFVNITDPLVVGNISDIAIINESCNNNGTALDFEIEYTDNTTYAETWVEVNLSASTSKTISIYYDNNTEVDDYEDPEGTWNTGFKGVWHLKELGTGTRYDSTQYDNDGTSAGYDNDEAIVGRIDGADSMDGTNDVLNCGNDDSLDIETDLTVELWLTGDDWEDATSKHITGNLGSLHGYGLRKTDTDKLGFTIGDGAGNNEFTDDSGTTWNNGQWYHVVAVLNTTGNWLRYYRNGHILEQDVCSDEPDPSTNNYYIGRTGVTKYWDGDFDEERVSALARTSDWINMTYFVVEFQVDMVSFGEEENQTTTSTTTTSTTTIIETTTYGTTTETTTDSTSTTSIATTTICPDSIIEWSCSADRHYLIKNTSIQIDPNCTFSSTLNYTWCDFNCSDDYITGTRCNYSPTMNGFIAFIIIVGLLMIIVTTKRLTDNVM